MNQYIEREAAFKELMGRILITGYGGLTAYDVKLCFSNLKNADVQPVVHAKWAATEAYPHNVYCTHCYKIYAQTHWTVWEDGSLPRNFCPNCGARMDGDDNG